MPKQTLRLGVVALRRAPVTRWGTGELRPSAVLPMEPDTAPRTLISANDGLESWYLGARDLVLYSGDSGHHLDNLRSGRPAIWVAMRGREPQNAEVICVTADPYEGEGYASDLDLTVEAVPMPALTRAEIERFVQAHHVDIPFKKRKRSPQDANALTRRAPRILQPEDKWHLGKAGGRRDEGGKP